MQKPTDIEIYINHVSIEDIETWLVTLFKPVNETSSSGKTTRYRAHIGDSPFVIVVITNVVESYSSIWFDSKDTLWENDIECARSAFTQFKQEVRCVENSWQEGQDPDQWYSISDQGENSIIWKC